MNEIERALADVLAGKRQAYRTIIELCEVRVRVLLAALLPDNGAVEDLTQDVFVTAFRKLSEYQPGTDFIAWLQTVARNLAMNERKRWVRQQTFLKKYRGEVEMLIEPQLEAAAAGASGDLLRVLRECVDHLQDKAKQVVEAFYFSQTPIHKIAEQNDRPPGWARLVLYRARRALGDCVRSKGALSDA